jgi:hypothetical protein
LVLICFPSLDAGSASPSGSRRWPGSARRSRRYLQAAGNEQVTERQIAGLPAALSSQLRSLVHDYENGDSLEVQYAHDADELDLWVPKTYATRQYS